MNIENKMINSNNSTMCTYKYILISIIVGIIILGGMLFLIDKKRTNDKIIDTWISYESSMHSHLGNKSEYKTCWIIKLNKNGTYKEDIYSYWPFKQDCHNCVIGTYTIPDQWIHENTSTGTYTFNKKKLILKEEESYNHLYHTKELGLDIIQEYDYNKDKHLFTLGVYEYTNNNKNCDIDFLEIAGNIEEYKVIN